MINETHDDQYCAEVVTGKKKIVKVLETDDSLAYEARWPSWPIHIIVIPKEHISSLLAFQELSDSKIASLLRDVAKVAEIIEKKSGKCRVLTNVGEYQNTKHLHWHVYSGEELPRGTDRK